MKTRNKIAAIIGVLGFSLTTLSYAVPDISEVYTYYDEYGHIVGGSRLSCWNARVVTWGVKTDRYDYEEVTCYNPPNYGGPVAPCVVNGTCNG